MEGGLRSTDKIFLWLCQHQRLHINSFPFQKHISSSVDCKDCTDVEDNVEHVLLNCEIVKKSMDTAVAISLFPYLVAATFPSIASCWEHRNSKAPSEGNSMGDIICVPALVIMELKEHECSPTISPPPFNPMGVLVPGYGILFTRPSC